MQEIVIVSGKGGTGKTSLTAAFCYLAKKSVICDADVDAADLHLLMDPKINVETDFMGGGQAVINQEECTQCGQCLELCRFDAIAHFADPEKADDEHYAVDPIACEGCGVCVDLCPVQAIDFPTKKCGTWSMSDTRFGPMVHARLGIAEENSGKLVTLVRKEARDLAEKKNIDLLITDGPPGIGCPVIASIGGATAVLIVTEPTVSGLHDMERVVQLAQTFKVPAMLCVNKFDLNLDQTEAIEKIARENNLMVLGRVPFDPIFTKAMIQGQTIFEYESETQTGQAIKQIWQKVGDSVAGT
jgi:MinD superfamily P-loop ATPase